MGATANRYDQLVGSTGSGLLGPWGGEYGVACLTWRNAVRNAGKSTDG